MILSVAVCDDLAEERLQMCRMVQSYCHRRGIELRLEPLESGEAFAAVARKGRWDLVLMDIYMPGMSGIDAARRLRGEDGECLLIFFTTSEEHGIVSYELHASDYLVKPVSQKALDAAMDWCMREHADRFRTICVRSEWESVEIPLRDIRYIEIRRHTAYICTVDRVIKTPRGMNALEEDIACDDFLRCHRSFLVNMRRIRRMEKRDFVMDNGDLVPIGSSDAAGIRQKFMDWIFLKDKDTSGMFGMF